MSLVTRLYQEKRPYSRKTNGIIHGAGHISLVQPFQIRSQDFFVLNHIGKTDPILRGSKQSIKSNISDFQVFFRYYQFAICLHQASRFKKNSRGKSIFFSVY